MTSLWEIVEQEYRCEHPSTELRYKTDSMERRQYQHQCLACGCPTSTFIAHNKVNDPDSVKPFDEELQKYYQRQKTHRFSQLADEQQQQEQCQQTEFWATYNDYLKSEKWQCKRAAVLKRDKYLCQACLTRNATQVHHLTYQHLYDEPLFELISVCDDCHKKITTMDREGRTNGKYYATIRAILSQ